MKIKIIPKRKKTKLKEGIIVDEAVRTLKGLGFVEVKKLGQGKFGTVFEATQGNAPYKTIAVKALNKGEAHTKKEVANYIEVNNARQQNELIAKHFPEVHNVVETNGMVFIYMELLDATHQGMAVVGDMFSGPESHSWMRGHTMKSIHSHYKSHNVPMAKSGISGRIMQMLISDKKREKLIQNFVELFAMNVSDPNWNYKELVGWLAGSHGILHASNKKANDEAEEIWWDLRDFANVGNELDIIIEDLNDEPRALWFILNMVKQVWLALPKQDKHNFNRWLATAADDLNSSFRKGADVPVTTAQTPTDEQIQNAAPEARSLLAAIKVLAEDFLIIPWDMHDLNALIRPSSGDIVIVDLGNFKKGMKLQQQPAKQPVAGGFTNRSWAKSGIFEGKKRKIKILIDKKRKT